MWALRRGVRGSITVATHNTLVSMGAPGPLGPGREKETESEDPMFVFALFFLGLPYYGFFGIFKIVVNHILKSYMDSYINSTKLALNLDFSISSGT